MLKFFSYRSFLRQIVTSKWLILAFLNIFPKKIKKVEFVFFPYTYQAKVYNNGSKVRFTTGNTISNYTRVICLLKTIKPQAKKAIAALYKHNEKNSENDMLDSADENGIFITFTTHKIMNKAQLKRTKV